MNFQFFSFQNSGNGGSRESRYEDRKQQRQEEIDSLKTALQVTNQKKIFFSIWQILKFYPNSQRIFIFDVVLCN